MGNYERDFIEKMREEIEIPDLVEEKLNDAYGMIRQGTISMKHDRQIAGRSGGYKRFLAAAAAVCTVCMLSGVFYVNPALARDIPILGNVFDHLQKVRKNSDYPDKDKTAYEQIKAHSVPVEEAGNTAEDAGIAVAVSDAYCDGYDIYFTMSLRVEDEEMKTADYLWPLQYQKGEDGEEGFFLGMDVMMNNEAAMGAESGSFQKTEEGYYVGLYRIPSMNVEKFEEKMSLYVEMDGVSAHKYMETEENGVQGFKTVEGKWELQFDVQMDTSANRTVQPNAEANGIIVQEAAQTPSNMHVTCYIPAGLAEKNPAFVLLDGSGNRVYMERGQINEEENGSQIQEMVFNASQADQFLLQVFDKNAGAGADGMPPLIAEIPFAME